MFTRISFLLLVLVMIGCTQKTESSTYLTNVVLGNGKALSVAKTNTKTTSVGVITGHVYNPTYSWSYKFTINDDEVMWYGGNGVPQTILFRGDEVYVGYLIKKLIIIESEKSKEKPSQPEIIASVVPVYERFIDERYFLNLFGKVIGLKFQKSTT
jgi:hypothetical protein